MGLDMYLNRYPRFKNATARDIRNIESYLYWDSDPKTKGQYTLEKWAGISMSDLPDDEIISHYKTIYQNDPDHSMFKSVGEEIGYWRKANQIHDWFVKHCQDGVDDCGYHNEVTKEQLIELRDLCQDVIDNSKLVSGSVKNGDEYINGNCFPIFEDGKVIEDPSFAMEHLPSCSGFFFGSEEYDEYYIDDLKKTIQICNEAITTTDFDTQMIYYVSSW